MRSVACLGPPQILFRKNLAPPRKPSMITFVFSHHCVVRFSRPGERFIEWRQRRDKFSANIASIQKARWFFANLARESVVQPKLLANRPSQSARRDEEPRRSPNIWNDLLWSNDPFCQSRFVPQCFLFRDSLKLPLLVRPGSLSRLPSRFGHAL